MRRSFAEKWAAISCAVHFFVASHVADRYITDKQKRAQRS